MAKQVTLLSRFKPSERKLIRSYQRLFDKDNPDAHVILNHLADSCHMFQSTFLGSGERDEMLFQEGERNVFLRILTYLNLSPEELLEKYHEEEDVEVTDENIV